MGESPTHSHFDFERRKPRVYGVFVCFNPVLFFIFMTLRNREGFCGGKWGIVVDLGHDERGVGQMFMGEYHHNLDAKGRLIVPAKFREQLGASFVLTRGMDGCLFGYPQSEWSALQEKLAALPLTKKDARTFVRFLYSAATECEIDRQGRINVPKTLMAHAELGKACVLVGVANRIEIWSAERWESFADDAAESFDDISENLMDFGL